MMLCTIHSHLLPCNGPSDSPASVTLTITVSTLHHLHASISRTHLMHERSHSSPTGSTSAQASSQPSAFSLPIVAHCCALLIITVPRPVTPYMYVCTSCMYIYRPYKSYRPQIMPLKIPDPSLLCKHVTSLVSVLATSIEILLIARGSSIFFPPDQRTP